MAALFQPALCRFLILYGVLYAGFGVQSPYLPTFLGSRGLSPEAIALVLAASGAVRLVAGPAAGRFADRLDAPKLIPAVSAAGAALMALGFLPARGLGTLDPTNLFRPNQNIKPDSVGGPRLRAAPKYATISFLVVGRFPQLVAQVLAAIRARDGVGV